MQQANECEKNLMQKLHTLTSCTWQQQTEIIKSMKPSPQIVKLINHRNYSCEIANLFAAHYPRTKLITALSDFLVQLFSIAANQLTGFANLLVSSECLIRLLASGNKVVSSCANEIIKSIIGNLDFRAKGKQIKFVFILEQDFLASKNNYVREKISLYFLLISTSFYYSKKDSLADFERKIVKEGLQDANQKVRANMRQILENIHHFEKQNNLAEVQKSLNRKSAQKMPLKNTKTTRASHQNKSLKALNSSSINQSSILDSFIDHDKVKHDRRLINEESFRFQLQRLKSGETWSIIQLAYESLIEAIDNGFLAQFNKDELYCETLQAISLYLAEKRSKIYQSSSKIFNHILNKVNNLKRDKVIAFCQQQSTSIIQQVIKNESVAILVLPTLINLNPSFYIAKIAQISTSIKAPRQKLLLLDSIVTNIHRIIEEAVSAKGNKKVSTLVKSMCHHVQKSTLKQKQVSLAALAIISQLKSQYPQQVLTALLCQSDKALSRILQLAESIDPSLKTAIIDYISSLKASSKKNSTCQSRQLVVQNKSLSEMVEIEMIRISQQQVFNLNKLGQLLLTHANQIDIKIFKQLIALLQFLCSSDLIMEYKILMQQLVKICGKEFGLAITQALESGKNNEIKSREFQDLMLLELLQLIAQQEKVDLQMLGNITKCLIEVYRSSQSLKKRNFTIQIMTKFDQNELCKWLTQEQLQLTYTYKDHLESLDQ